MTNTPNIFCFLFWAGKYPAEVVFSAFECCRHFKLGTLSRLCKAKRAVSLKAAHADCMLWRHAQAVVLYYQIAYWEHKQMPADLIGVVTWRPPRYTQFKLLGDQEERHPSIVREYLEHLYRRSRPSLLKCATAATMKRFPKKHLFLKFPLEQIDVALCQTTSCQKY